MPLYEIRYKKLRRDAVAPFQAHDGDAGWDLTTLEKVAVEPGEVVDLPTGLAIEIPAGHYGRVCSRSSTMRKRGLLVLEGVADAGFRGEWLVGVFNPTYDPIVVHKGERLAQLIISPFTNARFITANGLSETARGTKGYGSSGR